MGKVHCDGALLILVASFSFILAEDVVGTGFFPSISITTIASEAKEGYLPELVVTRAGWHLQMEVGFTSVPQQLTKAAF